MMRTRARSAPDAKRRAFPHGIEDQLTASGSTISLAAGPRAHAPRTRRPGRLTAHGKFLYDGDEKFLLRGVTYGTFSGPDDLPAPRIVGEDFAAMALNGINAVRTYTAPPAWLLDLADEQGLRVLVGLPWEQHVAFLEDRARRTAIERRIEDGVAACAGHPAVLGYAIGNEIPPSIARWYGPRRIERFLERLYERAKRTDPNGLVTYANFPSTEYLELPFLDFVAFNVYLEQPERLGAYLARLHTIAGDRPLLLTELGLDSERNGADGQAAALATQLRQAVTSGCAGAFAFAWTDEWARNGDEVTDWSFGLVDRDRSPKPALAAVADAYRADPPPALATAPRVSVVICTYNGARTLEPCLAAATRLDYPDVEVIVVDDGSTDCSGLIARDHPVRLITTEQLGLSAARNSGIEAATGEIVAFLDDDCVPEPDWLRFAVRTLTESTHAGVGGPNLPPTDDPFVAGCVAHAPGGPTEVLLSDTQAEHVAGCNMLFWRDALIRVGGFDPQFRQAGDDVDLCWRIHDAGLTLGFSPAAVVWHRRRASVVAYLRQQRSYGRAEALLERKWPERHNAGGHVTWRGRIYTSGLRSRRRREIDYGPWGGGLFQGAVEPAAPAGAVAALMPEWYIAVALLALGAVLSPWLPLLTVLGTPVAPLALVTALVALSARSGLAAARVTRHRRRGGRRHARTALVAALSLLQPLARLSGRVRGGLTPWRRRVRPRLGRLLPRTRTVWIERGRPAGEWLTRLETELKIMRAAVGRGGRYDRWDLAVRVGGMGAARVRLAIEEHGDGRQLLRYRIMPRPSRRWLALLGLTLACTVAGLLAGDRPVAVAFGFASVLLALRTADDCAAASACVDDALLTIGGDR